MSIQTQQPPDPLQSGSVEARLLKREIWERMWKQNEHYMGVIVGREGSGKSHSGIKIAETVDPTFDGTRVVFDPVDFIKQLQEWKEQQETKGKMIVIDEAGVGVGVRTWYDKDQIMLNKILQIIRDENMGVLFTIPRLEELDSQTEGRFHAFMEMMQKNIGNWVTVKYLLWDPTRDGRNKIYREYPELSVGGFSREIKRLRISPPSQDTVEVYEQRKSKFQDREYQKAIDEMEDDVDDEKTVKEVAIEIANSNIKDYVDEHSQNHTPYINDLLIRADYELSQNDAKAVKALLNRQYSEEELAQYV